MQMIIQYSVLQNNVEYNDKFNCYFLPVLKLLMVKGTLYDILQGSNVVNVFHLILVTIVE